jgi:hypothetical protein
MCKWGKGSFFDLGSAGVESAGSDRELPACFNSIERVFVPRCCRPVAESNSCVCF